jgi:hypothetical protein
MACSTDRYAATYVVAPNRGPPDCQAADFTDIQSAINALPPGGGRIFVKAGNYIISGTIQIKASNVQIQGEGMGITNIVADQTMTDSPAIEAYNADIGYDLALAADTARGDTTLRLTAQDAANVTPGDAALLYSDKSVDCEHTDKHAGEVKRVVSVNKQTGVITLDDQIHDAYLTKENAKVAKICLLRNIRLADLSVTTQAPVYHGGRGLSHFRFVDNLQIERVEAHCAYVAGIDLVSVINSAIADCYVHHIHDVDPPKNVRYGVVIGSGSQNVNINGCRFSHTRHAVTTGGSGGSLANGVQRNIIVSNCTSMAADTAHFDTHDPAENVSFVGCVAIGGVPAAQIDPKRFPTETEVVGFQIRGANGSIVGCSVLQAIGKGIMIFEGHNGTQPCHTGSDGATITGNMIADVKSVIDGSGKNSLGVGIFFDSSGTSRHMITGNVIKQCEGSAILGAGKNNDILVSGNVIDGTNLAVIGASISFDNAERITVSGNKIMNNKAGQPIEMRGNSKNWHIANNSFAQNKDNSPASLKIDTTVINNFGYNPVGIITNPWQPNSDLTNEGGASSDPTSAKVYTVRQTPKTIIVAQGDVSQIAINGTPMRVSAGSFKLGIGETIAITYRRVPTTKVWAD